MADNIIDLTSANFEAEVLHGSGDILVDFWAPWCGPCRTMGPVLQDIARDYSGLLKVGKVNVDDSQELALQYSIMSIPTMLLFKAGSVEKKVIGALPKKRLIEELGLPPRP